MSFQRTWGEVSQNVLDSNHPSLPIVSWSRVLTLSVPPSSEPLPFARPRDWGGDVVSVCTSGVPDRQILVSFPQVYRKQKVYLANTASRY